MSLIKQLNEMVNAESEMQRLADHWKQVAAKRSMTDEQLRDAVGNDLEQLEYSPEQVGKMVQTILHMIRSESK
jgi:hypothetical protein